MKQRLPRIFATAIGVLFALLVAACNTMEGAGKDIEAVGDAVQDAADDDD